MNTPTKIVFVHLLNDFSGSPLVLSNVVRGMQAEGYACDLITCRNSEGFLSNLEGVNYRLFAYHWHANRWLRLFLFLWSQVLVFAKIWAYRREKVIIYVNTLLPFGATLAGKLLGKKVVVHVHESSLQPAILKGFLRGVANFGATKSIFVSTFLSEKEQLPAVSSATVHNALSDYFKQSADNYRKEMKSDERFRILMLCSLKAYKGVHEFVEIARKLPELHFELVINAGTEAIEKYFATEKIPENLGPLSESEKCPSFLPTRSPGTQPFSSRTMGRNLRYDTAGRHVLWPALYCSSGRWAYRDCPSPAKWFFD